MISRYEVWLNDMALSAVDPSIYITDIKYEPVKREYTTPRLMHRDGVFSGNPYISESSVTITFMARKYSTSERQAVIQGVVAWAAKDGWLRVSDRPEQEIYVRCTAFPAAESVRGWTDDIEVEFTAYDFPYWQDRYPQVFELDDGDSETVNVISAFPAVVEAEITAGAAVTSFTVTAGNTSIALTDLSLSANDVVLIRYTADSHILEIKKGTTSLLDKRTTASSDDLIMQPGENTVSFTASADATCKLSVKGVTL